MAAVQPTLVGFKHSFVARSFARQPAGIGMVYYR